MKNVVLTTERLVLREMCREDQASLNKMLQDPEVMYAYAHAFSDEEAEEWLERQLARYRQYGFGLWAVISKVPLSGITIRRPGMWPEETA